MHRSYPFPHYVPPPRRMPLLSPRAFKVMLTALCFAGACVVFAAGYDVCWHSDRALIEKAQGALRENAALKSALDSPDPTPRPLEAGI